MSKTQTNPTQVMVIEDNRIFRHAIAEALDESAEFSCIAEAISSEEAFLLLETEDLQPDIILLDLEMPGTHGLDALPKLLKKRPATRVIILTQSDRELHVLKAITRGASGYLLKTAPLQDIFDSIREVCNGGASLDPSLAGLTLKLIQKIQSEIPEEDDSLLTTRELEVLQLLSKGFVKKEIASQLELSQHAIDHRIRRVYSKLQVQNVAAAVTIAVRKGWI
jgi:DNA-binding NarL/FixJ family response regulator